jgi:DNA-binding NtrC family response regulator
VSEQRTKLQPRRARVVKRVSVRVERGPDAGAACAPDAPTITVGSSADNDLVLADPTVSRYHLELVRTQHGVAVTDLGSRNGTFAGDLRIERAVVPPGMRLAIGSSTIVVEDAGDIVAPPDDPDERVPDLVGDSPAMLEVSRLVRRLAGVTSSVLVHGETGAGKEVVARALHNAGPRRDAPFVVVDCGSLPATLIESQLFGHEKGAFTGADTRRIGAFERAGGGTVFLDEIGELPLDVQPALLGVLERRRFCRVGGAEDIAVDVRVLAATHRDLRAEVNAGRFRADLYYRLAVARIVVPPLRERPEDIGPLVEHFVERITGVPGENPLAAAIPDLARHTWNGNVRELRNVVESALVMGQIHLEGAAPVGLDSAGGNGAPVEPCRDARADALARFEREYLGNLIEQCGGNASEAARRAKMDRPYLLTLLRRHRLR